MCINSIFLCQKRNGPQRSAGPVSTESMKSQAPNTKSSVGSVPSPCILAIEMPHLPPTSFCLCQWCCSFSPLHLFFSSPECLLFLIRILPVYLSSSSFNLQLNEEDTNDLWLCYFTQGTGFLLALFLHPLSPVSSLQGLLEVSLLIPETHSVGHSTLFSYSRLELAPIPGLTGGERLT